MYLLEYTPQALHDLQTIKAYIEENFGISVANNTPARMFSIFGAVVARLACCSLRLSLSGCRSKLRVLSH